jgi:hypothetical protein
LAGIFSAFFEVYLWFFFLVGAFFVQEFFAPFVVKVEAADLDFRGMN